jgi:cytochrome c peroxidase
VNLWLRFGPIAVLLAACASAADAAAPSHTPPPAQVFPALSLDGVGEHGERVALRTESSEEGAGLLLVRVQGGTWCGTCLWHAAHTAETLAGWSDRVQALDLVLGGSDAEPASLADAASFRDRLDDGRGVTVAPVAREALGSLLREGAFVLPLVVVVERRTMGVLQVLSNPHLPDLRRAIEGDLAALEGRAPEAIPDEPLVDGLFHRDEWDLVQAMALPAAMTQPPPSLSPLARLGKRLFYDAGLSPSGKVACATCHAARHGLSDGRPQGHGLAAGRRHTPRIALAAFARHQMWDGRVDSLDEQALLPLGDPREMDASPATVALRIAQAHAVPYGDAFPGATLLDVATLASAVRSGRVLGAEEARLVDGVFRNVGRALAAYEGAMRVREDPLDAYARGNKDALTFLQKQGLSMFLRLGCTQCHWGPRLTNDAFHVTRTPTGDPEGVADRGRGATAEDRVMDGAFKTPSLRGVAAGGPFGHGGAQATLTDVLAAYGNGGLPAEDMHAVGTRAPWLPRFGETPQWSIAAFLGVLKSEPVVP